MFLFAKIFSPLIRRHPCRLSSHVNYRSHLLDGSLNLIECQAAAAPRPDHVESSKLATLAHQRRR